MPDMTDRFVPCHCSSPALTREMDRLFAGLEVFLHAGLDGRSRHDETGHDAVEESSIRAHLRSILHSRQSIVNSSQSG
jgi:hypothetical protein